MMIYFLQVMCYLNEEKHYENVYPTKEKAISEGKVWLEKLLREQYEDWFEDEEKNNIPNLTDEQLFKLKACYDFSITEYNPKKVDKLENINNLPIVKDYDIYDLYSTKLQPAKIVHNYDYKGNEKNISGIFIFNFKGKRKEKTITMNYEDYNNKIAGTKFKKGDIVKIKKSQDYSFQDKLHVITDIPHKSNTQKFFRNTYDVIVNHNAFDEGCHIDVFYENELELYTGELPKDSPITFLSKYFKGEIELKDINWSDIECGKITLNENKSFRDFPEIIKQLEGEKNK